MSDYKQQKGENFDDYTYRIIKSRKELGLEYDELYDILYQETISNEESRKRLYGITTHINRNMELKFSIPESFLEKETFELKSDGSHELQKFVEACEEDLKSPDKIMEILGYDPLEWELTSSRHNRWNVYSKRDGKQLMYSLKANLKPRKIKITVDKITDIVNKLDLNLGVVGDYMYVSDGDVILEIPMMDVHFNKFIDERITGTVSNMETVKQDYLSVVNYFLSRVKDREIKKIIFPVGQDFFNSEFDKNTTQGTPQDNEKPSDIMFEEGTTLIFQSIELCRKVAPVEVLYVAGNHDMTIAYYAMSALKRGYDMANIKGVTFDLLIKRKYVEFGKCLIGYTHGNKEKAKIEKENLMQVEASEAWGRTKYREWHLGHEHHEDVIERGGIKYRKINSITATDNWHYENGYVSALRMAQAFLWHKDFGLLDIYNCPII